MKVMMKIIILSMVMVSMISMLVLSGCKEAAAVVTEAAAEATEAEATEAAATEAAATEAAGEPIKFGNLAVFTGPFGHFGNLFDGSTFFALRFIEEDPPLGRPIEIISEDAGTVGHGAVSRKLVEQNNVDILWNIESGYPAYKEFLLAQVAENGKPLLPSIHGGGIDAKYGGTGEEPIFRGMPMDTDIALANALYMKDMGATKIVCIAVEWEEMQVQQAVSAKACEYLGMEVLDGNVDLVPESPSYAAEAAKVAAMNPDGVIIYAAGEDSGTIVKNLSEAGVKAMILGETNMTAVEFMATATPEAVKQQVFVKAATFGMTEGPAADFYFALWDDPKNADLLKSVDGQTTSTYVMAAYDLLNVTFLAIELAGTTDSHAWADAMYKVTMSPGKKVYSYAEGIKALRAGEDIDYDGITGSMDYTPTGVVSGTYQIQDWSSGELVADTVIDGTRVLELSTALMK
jgi:ABC-type branched-subunit amino acid transport system substrate-binding protein